MCLPFMELCGRRVLRCSAHPKQELMPCLRGACALLCTSMFSVHSLTQKICHAGSNDTMQSPWKNPACHFPKPIFSGKMGRKEEDEGEGTDRERSGEGTTDHTHILVPSFQIGLTCSLWAPCTIIALSESPNAKS